MKAVQPRPGRDCLIKHVTFCVTSTGADRWCAKYPGPFNSDHPQLVSSITSCDWQGDGGVLAAAGGLLVTTIL